MTTGNRLDRLPGDTVVVGLVGNVPGGNVEIGVGVPVGEECECGAVSTVVIDAFAGDWPAPCTVTLSVTSCPATAAARTGAVISISNAWLAGSEPSEHEAPWLAGQSVKTGAPIAFAVSKARALTCVAAEVLQTQTE